MRRFFCGFILPLLLTRLYWYVTYTLMLVWKRVERVFNVGVESGDSQRDFPVGRSGNDRYLQDDGVCCWSASFFRGIKSELLIEEGKLVRPRVSRFTISCSGCCSNYVCMRFWPWSSSLLDSVTHVWCPETVVTSETEVYPVFVDVCVYGFV